MQDWAIDYIRHVLREKGWSATKLADAANVSSSTLTRPLSRPDWPHKVSRNTIHKVWQASGIDPEPFANAANELFFQGSFRTDTVGEATPDGYAPTPEGSEEVARRILSPDDQIRIEIIGDRAEVHAIVGKDGIAKLVQKLSNLAELLS